MLDVGDFDPLTGKIEIIDASGNTVDRMTIDEAEELITCLQEIIYSMDT